jgi:large subunit ribosomal protein L32e
MSKKFLRRTWSRFSKLGKGRKKKQKWRRPSGRDNKMRERRKGYPSRVSVGYKQPVKEQPILVSNVAELSKVKNKKVIIGNVGKRKKIEIAKKSKEMKIEIQNLNVKKFLKGNEKSNKPKEEKEK